MYNYAYVHVHKPPITRRYYLIVPPPSPPIWLPAPLGFLHHIHLLDSYTSLPLFHDIIHIHNVSNNPPYP